MENWSRSPNLRERTTMASLTAEELRAYHVLKGFVRDHISTFRIRRERRSARSLLSAFNNVRPCHQRVKSSTSSFESLERRKELVRRFSASQFRPPSPVIDNERDIITKSVHIGAKTEHRRSDSDEYREPQQHHEVFEVVVHHLYTQLQHSQEELAKKERRICELDDLVASLVIENKRLAGMIGRTNTSVPSRDESNQRLTA